MSTDTPTPERVTLTDEERKALQYALAEDINDAAQSDGPMPHWWGWFIVSKGGERRTLANVERILAAREQALRLERSEWIARYESLCKEYKDVVTDAERWVALADRYPSRDVYSTAYAHVVLLRRLVRIARGGAR